MATLKTPKSRRRTHCPEGRRLYRYDDLPAELATVSMLRSMRRRLAEGQEPVASLLFNAPNSGKGWCYTPLYKIAEAAELPPLKGKRLQAYMDARTCARCGHVSTSRLDTPAFRGEISRYDAGRRLCLDCLDLEAKAAWLLRQSARRSNGTYWARLVVDDPHTVLVAEMQHSWHLPIHVRAEYIDGTVLLDAQVWVNQWDRERHADESPAAVDVDEISGELIALAKARRVSWSSYSLRRLLDAVRSLGQAAPRIDVLDANQLVDWYTKWRGQRDPDWMWRYTTGEPYGYQEYLHQKEPVKVSPAAAIRTYRELLQRMAVDDHPDEPLTCPTLGLTGREMCGGPAAASGFCGQHNALILPRTRTAPVRLDGGVTQYTPQRTCNGCEREIGDATQAEIAAALLGQEPPDVTDECPTCWVYPPSKDGPP